MARKMKLGMISLLILLVGLLFLVPILKGGFPRVFEGFAVRCVKSSDCAASQFCGQSKCKSKYKNGEDCYTGNECISGMCEKVIMPDTGKYKYKCVAPPTPA